MRAQLREDGVALTERLCVYPRYIDAEWLAPAVLDTIRTRYWTFIPRRGSGRTEPPAPDPPRARRPRRSQGPRGRALSKRRADGDVRRDAAGGDRGAARGRRRAARGASRGTTVTFVVNRNINVSNVCTVGCAFCGFGQGRRSPDAYEHERGGVRRARAGGRRLRRERALHPVGDPSRLDAGGLPGLAAPREAHRAGSCTCTPTARWRSRTCATSRGLPPAEVFARLREAGLGSTPGTAAEVLHDGVRERISPNKLPVARWVEIIEASHTGRAALDGDGDVRAHRGAVGARRAHARRARAAGAHGRHHGVRAAVVHPVPDAARAARTVCEEISREENLKHTAVFRLALGRSVAQPAGELGQDGHRRARPRRCAGASTISAAR